jgi:hypothetical protein
VSLPQKFLESFSTVFASSAAKVLVVAICVFLVSRYLFPPKDEETTSQLERYKSEYTRLTSELAIAQAENYRNRREFQINADSLTGLLSRESKRLLDSIQTLNGKLTSVSVGSGTAEITGEGKIVEGEFADRWLYARIKPISSGTYDLNYKFRFRLGDVTTRLETESGTETEVYSVFLQSLVDTTARMYVGNYRRSIVNLIEPKRDDRKWYWDDLAVNGDAVFGGHSLELGLSVSPFSLSSGGREAKSIIARFPEVGVSSDFKGSAHLYGGARLNAGHFLPWLRDFYVGVKYGIGMKEQRTGWLFSIGTTL